MSNTDLHAIFYKGDIEDNYIGHQAEEILKLKIYAPFLENKVDPVVIDIGANIGLFSLYASKYAKQIYALEPAVQHFDTLNRMIAFNKLTNIKPIQKALYYEKTKLPFYHNDLNQTMWSLYANVQNSDIPPEMVETVTLEDLFKEEKIDHVDLLKLDCEGSEGEILGGKPFTKVADKIDTIVMEYHSFSIRPLNQVLDSLKNRGFRVSQTPHDAQLFVAQNERTIK